MDTVCVDVVGNPVEFGSVMCAVPDHGDPHIGNTPSKTDRELLNEIHSMLTRVEETINRADKTIATIAAEVKPTLDALTGNPMVKMFLTKGKDK